MALIKCNECGTEISDKAALCQKCGAPVGRASIVTTQQTSKRYKAGMIASIVLMCAGIVSCTAESYQTGTALTLVGLAVYIWSRFGAWWNNR